MKNHLSGFGLIVLLSAVFPLQSSAAGFFVPHQDSAAMGMAGAFVGQADNPSAVWYNPAGITELDGTQVSVGVTAIRPIFAHENLTGTTDVSERETFFPVQLFATRKMNDNISFGLGINSPFGLADNWSVDSSTASVATFTRLLTININPNIAFRVNDSFSVAAGIDYMIVQATMEKLLPPAAPFRLEADGTGLGANVGVRFKESERLTFGLSYRSRLTVAMDGKAEVSALGLSNSARADLRLPDVVQFGASYKPSDRLTLNADLDYTWWSVFRRLDVQSNTILFLTGGATDRAVDEKNWENTWGIHIGGQYQLAEHWKLRAGYFYDESAIPSSRFETSCPDADKHAVAIGAGYADGSITVDAAYLYSWFNDRDIRNSFAGGAMPVPALDGRYKSDVHIAALTVAFKF